MKGVGEILNILSNAQNVEDLKDIDVNRHFTVFGENYTILSYCIRYYPSKLKLLIKCGVNIEDRIGTRYLTPLHFAVVYSKISCIETLIDAGAKVNVVEGDGESIITDVYGRDIITLLVDAGLHIPITAQNYCAQEYYAIVQKRISFCRQALLALLSACTASKLHNGAAFGPKGGFAALKDIMIQMASQAWAMRGGEGVGPRGHLWN